MMQQMVPRDIPRIEAPLTAQEVRVLADERIDALFVGRIRPRGVKGCSELQDKRSARGKSMGERHHASAGLEGELGEPGGERALSAEELHRT